MSSPPPLLTKPRPAGFSARVDGASLVELIQLNCLGRQRVVFEVSSGVRRGLLFFDSGQVIHAQFEGCQGADAVQRMFELESGTFRPIHAAWPRRPSIFESWEGLVLRVAAAHDEAVSSRSWVSAEVVEFPGVSKMSNDRGEHEEHGLAEVHLDAEGRVTFERGPSQGLEDAAVYVKQMADVLGDRLGLGPVLAVSATASKQQLRVVALGDGGLLALRGAEYEVQHLRQERES